jgi:hypothetical protein
MPGRNVELVRAAIEAASRRDVDGFIQHSTPDFEIHGRGIA